MTCVGRASSAESAHSGHTAQHLAVYNSVLKAVTQRAPAQEPAKVSRTSEPFLAPASSPAHTHACGSGGTQLAAASHPALLGGSEIAGGQVWGGLGGTESIVPFKQIRGEALGITGPRELAGWVDRHLEP